MSVDIGSRITCADLRQPGTPRLKPPDHLNRSIRPPGIPPAIQRRATRWDAIRTRHAIRRTPGTARTIQRLAHLGAERPHLPSRNDLLLQVGGVLAPATRLDTFPGDAYVGTASPNMPLRPVTAIGLIRATPKLIHAR
jgi:hypothetical protein